MFCHFSILDFIFTPVIRNFFSMLYNFICTEPVTMKMLSTKSMRESISTRTTSKLITTLMTTKRSLTSPRPIKLESTQMRSIKMGITDKTTPSREMTKTIPTTEMVSERRVLDGVTLRRPSSKQKKGVLSFFFFLLFTWFAQVTWKENSLMEAIGYCRDVHYNENTYLSPPGRRRRRAEHHEGTRNIWFVYNSCNIHLSYKYTSFSLYHIFHYKQIV